MSGPQISTAAARKIVRDLRRNRIVEGFAAYLATAETPEQVADLLQDLLVRLNVRLVEAKIPWRLGVIQRLGAGLEPSREERP